MCSCVSHRLQLCEREKKNTMKNTIKENVHLIKVYPYGSELSQALLFSVIIKDNYTLSISDGKAERTHNDCSVISHDGIACAKTYKSVGLAKRSLKKHLATNFTGWDGAQFIIYGNSTVKRRKGGNGAYILGVIY